MQTHVPFIYIYVSCSYSLKTLTSQLEPPFIVSNVVYGRVCRINLVIVLNWTVFDLCVGLSEDQRPNTSLGKDWISFYS